jgi:endonuclease/exonuclease/phosphatase family metal-dependent hydrolase
MKALGTYLCWTQLSVGNNRIQVLNCYLQPGEQ